MNLIVDLSRMPLQATPDKPDFTPAPTDHDIPVLGVELEPAFKPEWESLLADGVQPALILGAERRTSGRR
jgi:hypothetical protein